ncbi:DMT family transporter [Bernardetia sp.]|uniref:DMT family transporter n=1 Tax=Bernardetia sp. TaxID=1937974 RepID=UPI0025B89D3C|nr:DMT family transporter [Bernardetia sp.]
MSSNVRMYVMLHMIVLLSSFIPSIVLLIDMPAIELLFLRTLAAFAMLLVLMNRKISPKLFTRQAIVQMLSSGILVFLYWGLSFISAKISTASVCLVGMATTSLWISFLDPILSKRKSRPFQVLVGMNAILGIYIIFNSDFDYGWGLAIGIIGAIFGALLTIYNAKLAQQHDAYVVTFYQMGGALISTTIFLPFYYYFFLQPEGKSFQFDASAVDYILILGLAFVFSIYAYSIFISVMKSIPPFTVALVSNLNPVYGTAAAILLFQENVMNTGFYIGTGLLLISVFAYPILSDYMKNYTKTKIEKSKKQGTITKEEPARAK